MIVAHGACKRFLQSSLLIVNLAVNVMEREQVDVDILEENRHSVKSCMDIDFEAWAFDFEAWTFDFEAST